MPTSTFSRDGQEFVSENRGREVEGSLQKILRWGIEAPGGRGGRRGMPASLITTALLGEQSHVVAILDQSLADDPSASGRERLTEALQALAEDPRFKQVVNAVQAKEDEAFTTTGRRRTGRGSPWADLREQRERAEADKRDIRAQVDESNAAHERLRQLSEQLLAARAEEERLSSALKLHRRREAAEQEHSAAQAEFDRIERIIERLADNEQALQAAAARETLLDADHRQLANAARDLAAKAEAAREALRELETGAGEQQRRIREQDAEKRQLAIKAERKEAQERYAEALAALSAAEKIKELQQALGTLESERRQQVQARRGRTRRKRRGPRRHSRA